jgi:CRP-like cAMP-binding protein
MNMSDKNIIGSCETCTKRWKNFQHLSKNELQYVNGHRYEATFKAGETLIKQGSPSSNALFLSSGLAKIYIEGEAGKDFIMSIAKPGRLILGPGAFVTSRYTYSVSALTRVQACFISFDVFSYLVNVNGKFAEGLLTDISAKSLRTHNRMVNLTQKKMPGRLADALLYFSNEIFESNEFELMLSRKEIGEFTCMAKESVVRIMKDFEDSGVIYSESAKIKILDKDKLADISKRG